jgi:hypothetical protein
MSDTEPRKPSDQEQVWRENRQRNREEAKEQLRQLVAKEGYYPLAQVSGPPCFAIGEPL